MKIKVTALFCCLIMLITASCDKTVPDKETETGSPIQTETEAAYNELKNIDYYDVDSIMPATIKANQSWDAMGIDPDGIIYFGCTGTRASDYREDFAVLSFDPETKALKYLGSFMTASDEADNLGKYESIPKGHTKFYYYNGKMYMASQSFHDFKGELTGLENMRGAHIYAFDIASQKLTDLSAALEDGVLVKNQGVIALNLLEDQGLLVGLTHPYSDLVFYDIESGKMNRYVKGIEWTLGNPLSREIIVIGDRVYLYRGTEDNAYSDIEYPVYVYDYSDDKIEKTGYTCRGGFWNGQALSADGKTTYVSTCCGELYSIDHDSGEIKHKTSLDYTEDIKYTYSLTLSFSGRYLYYIPTEYKGGLMAYDTMTNKCSLVKSLPQAIYTGSGIKSEKNGKYYFMCFGIGNHSWTDNVKLMEIDINSN